MLLYSKKGNAGNGGEWVFHFGRLVLTIWLAASLKKRTGRLKMNLMHSMSVRVDGYNRQDDTQAMKINKAINKQSITQWEITKVPRQTENPSTTSVRDAFSTTLPLILHLCPHQPLSIYIRHQTHLTQMSTTKKHTLLFLVHSCASLDCWCCDWNCLCLLLLDGATSSFRSIPRFDQDIDCCRRFD